ncbi:innexin inx2 [Papilio machaon]|nr:innexin inx2 [Papilio machaon]
MMDLLSPFRSFLKPKKIITDNNVFRLHYKFTVIMLFMFTLMVTSKQFFGEPMHCMSGSDKDDNKDAINNYCWIYGTYTLKSQLNGIEGKHMVYAGVGPGLNKNDDQIEHTYYQWVCFVLLGQAFMFYIPHYLWKSWEGGRVRDLSANLTFPIVAKDWSDGPRQQLLAYFNSLNTCTHNMYALRFAFCEFLNLANVIGQIFLLDIFLDGSFRDYGAAVASFTHHPRLSTDMTDFVSVNPMDKFFPKVTKCWFRSYGPSGTIQFKDRLCVLPLNVINEKIFIILWFWLVILASLSALAVLFRVLIFCIPALRTYILTARLRRIKRSPVSKIVKHYSFGDWFVLYLLSKNINQIVCIDLVKELAKDLQWTECV